MTAVRTSRLERSCGFSTIEFVLAMGLTLVVIAGAVTAIQSFGDLSAAQTEVADMHQRVRAAADTLSAEILKAGLGAYSGPTPGALVLNTAAILPYRLGGATDDPPGSFRTDTITVTYVRPGSIQVITKTYWLKRDDSSATDQLMMSSGAGPDVPVVDNVVALGFEYDGDAEPPTIETYGPKPSPVAVAPYAAGENCVFVQDGSELPAPRMPALGLPGSLVKLGAEQLGDGPWCPDSAAPDRWDADLLRIRVVHVSLRVQAGLASLRGPASTLFMHGGTSLRAAALVPDIEIHFQVTPPNLSLGR